VIANIAIDPTGYGLHHAPQHYENMIGRRKRYMEHFPSIDTDNQAIIVSEDWRSHVDVIINLAGIRFMTVKNAKL
jgi:hypothetical protein